MTLRNLVTGCLLLASASAQASVIFNMTGQVTVSNIAALATGNTVGGFVDLASAAALPGISFSETNVEQFEFGILSSSAFACNPAASSCLLEDFSGSLGSDGAFNFLNVYYIEAASAGFPECNISTSSVTCVLRGSLSTWMLFDNVGDEGALLAGGTWEWVRESAVPEPSVLAMLSIGLAGFGFRCRRTKA